MAGVSSCELLARILPLLLTTSWLWYWQMCTCSARGACNIWFCLVNHLQGQFLNIGCFQCESSNAKTEILREPDLRMLKSLVVLSSQAYPQLQTVTLNMTVSGEVRVSKFCSVQIVNNLGICKHVFLFSLNLGSMFVDSYVQRSVIV